MTKRKKLRLGVNIDHVATLRNARGGSFPCPIVAAKLAQEVGADGITAHLREDRRHIRDADIFMLKEEINLPLNMEMAATEEMLAIALEVGPHAACIVPEKRQELTTEGGLDVVGQQAALQEIIPALKQAGIRVSLFIDPDSQQIEAAQALGADIVELHTGTYCLKQGPARQTELTKLQYAAEMAGQAGLECHAGHGLTYDTVGAIAAIPLMVELNIGHFLISNAVFIGLEAAIGKMRLAMHAGRESRAA